MQIGLSSTARETFRHILSTSGIKGIHYFVGHHTDFYPGFYAGIDSLILREIPFSALEFPIYEYMKKKSYEENGGKDLTFLQNARNGAVAGSIGILIFE